MYEKLTELITTGDYKEALYEFQEEYLHIGEREPKDAAKLCLLEASLWEALADSTSEYDAIARGIAYDGGNYELFLYAWIVLCGHKCQSVVSGF